MSTTCMLLISEIDFKFSTDVQITDQQTCNEIEKLCVEMVTGTSSAMAAYQVGPQEANIRCHQIEVDCSGGKFIMIKMTSMNIQLEVCSFKLWLDEKIH